FRKKTDTSPVVRLWVIEPRGMAGCYDTFPLPFHDARGSVRIDNSRLPYRNLTFDLVGKTRFGDSPVGLRGTIKGEKTTSQVILPVTARNVRLDDHVDRALKHSLRAYPSSYDVVRQFLPEDTRTFGLGTHPLGTGHLLAQIRRKMGERDLEQRYVVTFENCRRLYDLSPYPVENVSGVLDLRPDGWECRDFRATHKGGEFFIYARSEHVPGPGSHDRVRVRVRGKDVQLDDEFEQALALERGEDRRGLCKTWKTLKRGGRLSVNGEVVHDPPQPQDIDVTVGVQGCTLRPTFFDYPLTDVCGTVHYSKDRVQLKGVRARHGKTSVSMESGLVVLNPDGAFTIWLEGIGGRDVVPDRDLLGAIPDPLRKTAEVMAYRDPFDIKLDLIIAAPQGTQGPLKFWW